MLRRKTVEALSSEIHRNAPARPAFKTPGLLAGAAAHHGLPTIRVRSRDTPRRCAGRTHHQTRRCATRTHRGRGRRTRRRRLVLRSNACQQDLLEGGLVNAATGLAGRGGVVTPTQRLAAARRSIGRRRGGWGGGRRGRGERRRAAGGAGDDEEGKGREPGWRRTSHPRYLVLSKN